MNRDKTNHFENIGTMLIEGNGETTLRDTSGSSGSSIKIIAVGDFDFHAESFIAMRQHGAEYLFENMTEGLRHADLRIGNLETILVESAYSVLGPKAHLISEVCAINGIKSAGFDVVTLANNHTMDGGEEGLKTTLDSLCDAGIEVVGAGRNENEARKPVWLTKKGISVCILAYSFRTGNHVASSNKAGCAEAILSNIISDLKACAHETSVKIVNLHMDAEFQELPAPDRISLCRKIVEAGANLIFCHHPHVIQGLEIYQGALIAYSLGNYVTPVSNYMRGNSNECHLSFQLEVDVSVDGVDRIKVIPIILDHEGRPHIAENTDREKILNMISSRSISLDDKDAVNSCYRKMIKKYCISLLKSIYYGFRYRNWSAISLEFSDVKNTPTKQKWIRDYLLKR